MGVARVCLMLLLLLAAVSATVSPALAQATATPEPTVTPEPSATPLYEVQHVLPSGALMVEQRVWTWGQLAIFGALLLLIAITVIEAVWRTLA